MRSLKLWGPTNTISDKNFTSSTVCLYLFCARMQVVSVDRSAATVAHVCRLSDALSQQHGVEMTAGRLLPLLCPLLVAPSLGARDLQALHAAVQVCGGGREG